MSKLETEKASMAYIKQVSDIQSMLRRLEAETREFFGKDPYLVNWGHVGDVSDIAAKLKSICDQVFKEGEYSI